MILCCTTRRRRNAKAVIRIGEELHLRAVDALRQARGKHPGVAVQEKTARGIA